ncbi:MAG: threonine synthase [Alphaproteobacteria bacterium]
MHYISTRGTASALGFDDVLLAGLASDGGLYLPQTWPKIESDTLRSWRGLSYSDLAIRVIEPFIAGSQLEPKFSQLVQKAYAGFNHPAVTPLTQLESNLWLLELFHGPTFAFKDIALQLLGQLLDQLLQSRGQTATIIGATSGDTGSAAIEACRDREALQAFILYPHDRISDVQRRQMTTVASSNIHVLAIDGTFDDCQNLIKALFADQAFRQKANPTAVNSINWARIMAQTVYYIAAAIALGAPDRSVSFAVPTGNFGNVFAAYAAKRMGIPIDQLIIGSNRNDVLPRFFASGTLAATTTVPTLSPSMDIQISSNFERFLFDLWDRNGKALSTAMAEFQKTHQLSISTPAATMARKQFTALAFDDEQTLATIKKWYQDIGLVLDPHSAIGVAAAERVRAKTPCIALATAHPAKFPEAIRRAIGTTPKIPEHLEAIMTKPERLTRLPNHFDTVRAHILSLINPPHRKTQIAR